MGGQHTHIAQPSLQQSSEIQNKNPFNNHQDAIHISAPYSDKDYRFVRKNQLLDELWRYYEIQRKEYQCTERIAVIQQQIKRYQGSQESTAEESLTALAKNYLESEVFPFVRQHEAICFKCTGKHWEVEEWKEHIKDQVNYVQVPNVYQLLSFKIRNPEHQSESLQVFIYKYLKDGGAYLRSDRVRNMKIYKKPLSEWQLTNLIFQHQYLVVQCEKSYWSFEKDTKRLIVQSSACLSDVRDKVLGEPRIKQMKFKWLGLREKWFPEVMYQSNQFICQDIMQVRNIAEQHKQVSNKYNVFNANCKVYAQHIMKNSMSDLAWKEIQTAFDFFHK